LADEAAGQKSSHFPRQLHKDDSKHLEASDELVNDSQLNDVVTTSTPATYYRDSPALDCFSGENPEITFEDWLPSLERLARWNEWPEKTLLFN